MSKEETDLKKVIDEVKASLQEKDIEDLKDQLFSQFNSNGNVSDLLEEPYKSLNALMQNKDLLNKLENSELTNQLITLLNAKEKKNLKQQLQHLLDVNVPVKKKINESVTEPLTLLQKELNRIKEELLSKYKTNNYDKEIQLLEALIPFVRPEIAKVLNLICECYRSGVIELFEQY
ncbi:hypothetical protein BBF96_04980 [Anoxybacter fermentans]|uniref:Uncharacterized protein n=1 Tax=Anoxybacter fermentans TaxID=1323375 RepID=A0A3Q9HRA9_9FIRM|nr:hypothetical protein [Anoxybacter fermentans]AZR72802.1 hypothetical protein BBF96_04980 [Anoxybacter fermentans]